MNDNQRNHSHPQEHWRARGAAQTRGDSIEPGAEMLLVLDLFFDHDSLYALRAAVAAYASDLGMPQPRVHDLVTVVHELAANSVQHGAGHGRAQIWHQASTVLCRVTDDGPPPAANSGSRTATQAESRDTRPARIEPGHGLWLIRQLTQEDVLQIGPGGTTATVSFACQPLPQRAPDVQT